MNGGDKVQTMLIRDAQAAFLAILFTTCSSQVDG